MLRSEREKSSIRTGQLGVGLTGYPLGGIMNAYINYHVWDNGKLNSSRYFIYVQHNLSYPELAPGMISDINIKKCTLYRRNKLWALNIWT